MVQMHAVVKTVAVHYLTPPRLFRESLYTILSCLLESNEKMRKGYLVGKSATTRFRNLNMATSDW
jgi:hypothetical protein